MDSFVADMERQGWALQVVEQDERPAFKVGDAVKLPFVIFVPYAPDASAGNNWGTELMWVVVVEQTTAGYVGKLDSTPSEHRWNKELREGSLITFRVENVVSVYKPR